MSNYIWLLDAGHGGMQDGRYATAPAKMYRFDDGLVFYEGVNNRAIVDKLIVMLTNAGIRFMKVYHPEEDTPLHQRVRAANVVHSSGIPSIYLSVHSDAMPDGAHGKGSGFAVYTSKGQTRSDAIAEIFSDVYRREFLDFKFRQDSSDGDADKEEDFYVLRKTNCPALLVENLFFDNRREAEFLLSEAGRQRIAETLFKAILETETTHPSLTTSH